LAPDTVVPDFTVRPPPAIIAGLTAQAEDALAAIRQAQEAGHFIAGSAELATGI
jgi:hypothetical protein